MEEVGVSSPPEIFAREPYENPAARASARSRAEKLPLHFLILRAPIFSLEGKGNFSARRSRRLRRLAAGYFKFRFLDLCIRFGKIISKVCKGFNSGAANQSLLRKHGSRP
jgi:hypothetical protein